MSFTPTVVRENTTYSIFHQERPYMDHHSQTGQKVPQKFVKLGFMDYKNLLHAKTAKIKTNKIHRERKRLKRLKSRTNLSTMTQTNTNKGKPKTSLLQQKEPLLKTPPLSGRKIKIPLLPNPNSESQYF